MFWYEEEVKQLEAKAADAAAWGETLFYGSSSIRLWATMGQDFPDLKPVNLGFGGSTLAACVWFSQRILSPYHPKRLILYAGDNDLGDGRNPEEVLIFFQEFATRVKQMFGDLPCWFISLKPSLARWNIVDKFKYTNMLVQAEINEHQPNWRFINLFPEMLDDKGVPRRDFYNPDGLHLSPFGYQVWTSQVNKAINQNI